MEADIKQDVKDFVNDRFGPYLSKARGDTWLARACSAKGMKQQADMGAERRSAAAKQGNRTKGAEKRSAAGRQRAATMGPKKLKLASMRTKATIAENGPPSRTPPIPVGFEAYRKKVWSLVKLQKQGTRRGITDSDAMKSLYLSMVRNLLAVDMGKVPKNAIDFFPDWPAGMPCGWVEAGSGVRGPTLAEREYLCTMMISGALKSNVEGYNQLFARLSSPGFFGSEEQQTSLDAPETSSDGQTTLRSSARSAARSRVSYTDTCLEEHELGFGRLGRGR
jgi:hypothetical protein